MPYYHYKNPPPPVYPLLSQELLVKIQHHFVPAMLPRLYEDNEEDYEEDAEWDDNVTYKEDTEKEGDILEDEDLFDIELQKHIDNDPLDELNDESYEDVAAIDDDDDDDEEEEEDEDEQEEQMEDEDEDHDEEEDDEEDSDDDD